LVVRVRSKKLEQKTKSSKTKTVTARRSANFKFDSWYTNAVLSIGVNARRDAVVRAPSER
jgi:hypothetical protein